MIGGLIPQNHSEELENYNFVDDYDQAGDQYTGNYKTFSSLNLTMKDGSVIKAGTDLTSQTTAETDAANGIVTVRFKEEFLQRLVWIHHSKLKPTFKCAELLLEHLKILM